MLVPTKGRNGGTGGGGATVFTGLSDVPNSYVGKRGRTLRVNQAENALIFGNSFFNVSDYGAKGDGISSSDGVVVQNSKSLTSVSALFTPGDVGKSIVVSGAGVGGTDLFTTIMTYVDSTTIILTANASVTVNPTRITWGTDDFNAIQNAINDASTHGGTVFFEFARYFTTGTFTLPENVFLKGATIGPFDALLNAGKNTIASTFLITNKTNYFLNIIGKNCAVEDFIFYYPNQVSVTSYTPKPYPATIYSTFVPGSVQPVKLKRCTFVNSYDAIVLNSSQIFLEDLFIGAFNIGLSIDHAYDVCYLNNIHHWPFWITLDAGTQVWPNNIDYWCLSTTSSRGFLFLRADSSFLANGFVFGKYTGLELNDSADISQNPTCSYGMILNLGIDQCRYNIRAYSTQDYAGGDSPGWIINGLQIVGGTYTNYLGINGIKLENGGSMPPRLIVENGTAWGTFNNGVAVVNRGTLRTKNMMGIDNTFITFVSGSSSPSVAVGALFKTANLIATIITSFLDAHVGKEITVIYGDANTTIANSGNIYPLTTNPSINTSIKYIYDGSKWYEVK